MRGKHGAAAAVRQEVQSREGQIEAYRSAVARLTHERNEARSQRLQEQQHHRRLERELRARLDQAASPKIEALERIIQARTEERDAARAEMRKLQDSWNKAIRRTADHFREVHHLHGAEIMEAAALLCTGLDIRLSDEAARLNRLPTAVADVIQRKRGER